MFEWIRNLFRRSQPLQAGTDTPTACDPKLYRFGTCIGVYAANDGAVRFEEKIKQVAREAKRPVDWHFVAGRAVVKAFPQDVVRVLPILERICGPGGR